MGFHLDFNDVFRQAVLSGLGLIPEVGDFMETIAGALWPEKSKDPVLPLDQLKTYVNSMMKDLIAQSESDALGQEIAGYQEDMKQYGRATSPNERNKYAEELLYSTGHIKPRFLNNDHPEYTLTYFVTFGTIRLGLLREKYLFYPAIYGNPDGNPTQTHQDILDEIKIFTDKAATARTNAIAWRKSKISITYNGEERIGISSFKYSWTVRDDAENYSHTYEKITHPAGPAYPDDESAAHADYDNRMYMVDNDYTAGLDELLAPSRLWTMYDPVNPISPTPRPIWWYNTLAKGINTGGNKDWDDKNFYLTHGPITKILIYGGDWLDGIEVFYGGVSSGLRGQRGGTLATVNIAAPEEVITFMAGLVGDYMVRFKVGTNLHPNLIGSGGAHSGADNFSFALGTPNPVQPTDGRLAYLAGKAAGNRVDQIRPAWLRYESSI